MTITSNLISVKHTMMVYTIQFHLEKSTWQSYLLLRILIGTCESEIFVRIESRIESAAAIRIKSGYSRLRVIVISTDEHRCADFLGSSNNIARSLLQC